MNEYCVQSWRVDGKSSKIQASARSLKKRGSELPIIRIRMRLNKDTVLKTDRVFLIPYEAKHVPKYNLWMQNVELQVLTASEPLTLEQEYDMQKSWREDEAKLTFIMIDPEKYATRRNEVDAMIGDVNMFCDFDEGQAECEVMIAESDARNRGIGSTAVKTLLGFALKHIPSLRTFIVRISADNKASIALFQKLGFEQKSFAEVFNEYTFQLRDSELKALRKFYETNVCETDYSSSFS